MTPKERAAMQQALEALEDAYENGFLTGITGLKTIDVLAALREALAEQSLQKLSDFHQSIEQADEEGKTTDYMLGFSDGKNYAHKYEQAEQEPMTDTELINSHCRYTTPLMYEAAPVRTKDLTPHEVTALIREGAADGGWQGFAQRVIAADREKNK